jgi:hypothetical protein
MSKKNNTKKFTEQEVIAALQELVNEGKIQKLEGMRLGISSSTAIWSLRGRLASATKKYKQLLAKYDCLMNKFTCKKAAAAKKKKKK